MELSGATREFVLHWGEMGTRWGVNRTVAQAHALLYLSPEPLTAEEIAETLSVARSNVSTSLKELQSWKLAQVVHRMGDRRDYFRTSHDVWELFMTVIEQRVEREIEPTDGPDGLRAGRHGCDLGRRHAHPHERASKAQRRS